MKKAKEVLYIPTKHQGIILSLEDLNTEQMEIAAVVLYKIDEWLSCGSPDEFVPL